MSRRKHNTDQQSGCGNAVVGALRIQTCGPPAARFTYHVEASDLRYVTC